MMERILQFGAIVCLIGVSFSIDTKYMYESCNSSSSLDTTLQLETSISLMYPLLMDCAYTVTVPSGKRILALVSRFELEQKVNEMCTDYLNVHDGAVRSSALINPSRLCGSSVSGNFTSTGTSMTFHFHSDRSAVYRGFGLIITAIQNGPCSSSQYSCNNGLCIDSSLKCDDYDQCGDNSDESDCQATAPATSSTSNDMALIIGVVIGLIVTGVIVGAIILHVYKKNQWKKFLHQHLEDPDVWNSSPSYPVTKQYYKNGRGNYNTLNNEMTEDVVHSASYDIDSTEGAGRAHIKTPY